MKTIKKLMKKTIEIDKFINFLENKKIVNIIYFNTNKLQSSYKDITKKTIAFSDVNDTNRAIKVGASAGIVNCEISSTKENKIENIFTHKEIIENVLKDNIYTDHLMVLKIRLSKIDMLKSKGNVVLSSKSVLCVINSDVAKSYSGRIKSKRNLNNRFENAFIYLEESFTYGVFKDFLFNNDLFFEYAKPDIDSDDFYMVCLSSSFSNINVPDGESSDYVLVEPIALIRDNFF